MKIIIEKSGRSFFIHAIHWVIFCLYICQLFIYDSTVSNIEDYVLAISCALWVGIAYVRFIQLTSAEYKLDLLENKMAKEIVNGFEKFIEDNKDKLIQDIKNKKDIKIKNKDERAN
jgi:hypothetical protein